MEENTFDIKLNSINNYDIIELFGYLDAHTAPKLEGEINKLVLNGRYCIIIDFKELDYISSAGLGVFMAFIEDIREHSGDIKFCSMKPKVYSVFDLLGFPLIFNIEKDQKEAINKFESNKK